MATKCVKKDSEPERYIFENGLSMQREATGNTPEGNPVCGRWVLRSRDGDWIDCDKYRIDIAERHDLSI